MKIYSLTGKQDIIIVILFYKDYFARKQVWSAVFILFKICGKVMCAHTPNKEDEVIDTPLADQTKYTKMLSFCLQ